MKCDTCPVASKCELEKKTQITSLTPRFAGQLKEVLETICPLEMAVELNVSVVGIEFERYIAHKRRFEKEDP